MQGFNKNEISEITSSELIEKSKLSIDFFLLDVRELHERNEFNIGGKWIPINEIPGRINELPNKKNNREIIIYCRSGYRSANVCHYLNELGYKNVFNLKGGILNWSNEH